MVDLYGELAGKYVSWQNLGPLQKVTLLVGPTFVKYHDQLKGAAKGIRRSPIRCAKKYILF